MEEKWYRVGKIVNTHGIRGEVRVISLTDFEEERFVPGGQLFVGGEKTEAMQPLTIDAVRSHKQFYLLKFEEYPSLNEVEQLKGTTLYISKEQLGELEDDEFYYHEIIGCKVSTEDGQHLGVVKEILSPGANDVWVVKRQSGKDLLIPYIEDVVKSVDVANKQIVVELLDGLVDDEI